MTDKYIIEALFEDKWMPILEGSWDNLRVSTFTYEDAIEVLDDYSSNGKYNYRISKYVEERTQDPS